MNEEIIIIIIINKINVHSGIYLMNLFTLQGKVLKITGGFVGWYAPQREYGIIIC